MSGKDKRHKWEPTTGTLVKCDRCGIELEATKARRGVGPCTGKGKDTVPAPTEPKTDQKPAEPKAKAPAPVLDLGICNACGSQLDQMPFNSGNDMIACKNRRCPIYRQRLRLVPAMSFRERRKRSKA